MSDLIDREALLRQIDIDSEGEPGYYGDTWKFIDTIKSMPSATDKNVGTKLGTDLAEVGTDCISRQEATDALRKMQTYKLFSGDDMLLIDQAGAMTELMMLPSAQPEPLKIDLSGYSKEDWERFRKEWGNTPITVLSAQPETGKWISADAIFGGVPFYCSECGEKMLDTVMGKPRWNFCPNCGAKMEK